MPLSPQPFHPAETAQPDHDKGPHGFKDWSQHVDDRASPMGQSRTPQPLLRGIDLTHPLVKVAAVAFVGYTLGRLIHRSAHAVDLPPPSRPPYRPGATEPYRIQPVRPRSDIRYR